MTFIRKWRDYLPTIDQPTMLAIAAVILVAIAYLFLGILIAQQFLERTGLNKEIALVEHSLAEAKELQKKRPGELREEIAAAQATLTAALKDFPSEAESMQEVNKIYQYASENQVEIVSLQAQPTPEGEEAYEAYNVKQFRLQATGSIPRLTAFLSQVEEGTVETLILTDVSIVESEGTHTLSANLTLYTSPLAPTPMVTLAPTPVAGDLAELERRLNDAWAAEDWEEAIGLIRQILSIDPNYDEMTEKLYAAHVNYGYKLLNEGKPGAMAQFAAALSIKPDGVEAMEGLKRLQGE